MLCSHQQDDSSSTASEDVDEARTRLQHLTLALQAKRWCDTVICNSIGHHASETAMLPDRSAARREVAEKLGRWHEEKKARSAVLQPLTQDGQQPQEPEAPKWLRELKEEYSQLQVCFGAALWSFVRSVEPAIVA